MKNSAPSKNNLIPAVFLDRDGVINVDSGYVYKREDLKLLPGVAKGIRRLKELGYQIFVITNQSGVARGMFTMADVDAFHEALKKELGKEGASVDDVFICPHHPEGKVAAYAIACSCRKPGTGLIEQACEKYPIDRSKSFLVGDKDSDIACAEKAHIHGIQMADTQYKLHKSAFGYAKNFDEVVSIIEAHR